jgi:Domain of unknown function (DUF4124)
VKTVRWPLLLAMLATAAYGGQVYRSTDANGNVVFSDRPTEKSEPVNVTVPAVGRPGNPITSPAAKAAAGNTQPGAQANAAADQKKEKVQTPAEKEADRAKNCASARQRQTLYDQSHRLYKAGANGEREYLNSAEIDEARAKAAADVATWCG